MWVIIFWLIPERFIDENKSETIKYQTNHRETVFE